MTKGVEKRSEKMSLRLPASLHARLTKAAQEDHRSMNDVVIIAVERYLESLQTPSKRKG
jgi:predicted HicB family RNase H-like nuclease